MIRNLFTALVLLALAAPSFATTLVGRAVSPSGDLGVNSFVSDTDYTIPGDMFGIRSTATPGTPGLPFAIQDVSPDFGDSQGIIDDAPGSVDDDPFFGVVDTVNGSGTDVNTATWEFDISSVISNLSVSIDFAAMGDFEDPGDFFDFEYAIDGAPLQPLFTSSINEDTDQAYTMADGTGVVLDDPVLINGTLLSNSFVTLSETIAGTGTTLELVFSAEANGGSEAFAFRNVEVTGVIPEPASVALLGLGGLALLRRRSA